jgi:sugar transferase EpsL
MSRIFKRTIDALVSATGLILLAPAMVTIGLVIWTSMGRPILFKQKRAGYRGRPFTLFKFRTMDDAGDTQGRSLPDKDRLTKVGIVLRRLSLDEFPQLWNVLIGDMSLVGPRPLLAEYLPRYSPEQARRHEVNPGITGWAQVNGRNALDWEQRFRLDIWYVDHWSLGLDAKIIWKTMQNVFKEEGISQHGHSTMPEFTGNDRIGL